MLLQESCIIGKCGLAELLFLNIKSSGEAKEKGSFSCKLSVFDIYHMTKCEWATSFPDISGELMKRLLNSFVELVQKH